MGRFELPPAYGEDGFDEESSFFQSLRADIEDWTRGRWWAVRLPLLLYLAWGLRAHLKDPYYGTLLFSGVTLAIHEIGHVIFGFAPMFFAIAGGTFLQLAAPVATSAIFIRQRDYFGVTVAGFWLSYSLFNVATYAEDAKFRDLPLVSLGSGEIIHDWNYMLTSLGMLESHLAVASFVRFLAGTIGFASLAAGVWLCWRMFRARPSAQ
ncbi:MAG TPA: hypothetical protein VMS12_10310 [Thermoanaerobaculia bacterium]|nr:hypothetical protein [Thermoanaerobaculia bacterium]